MTRATLTCIARICPACRAPNTVTVITTDIRPTWKMNCSRCGGAIPEVGDAVPALARDGGSALVRAAAAPLPAPRQAAKPQESRKARKGRKGRKGRRRRRTGARRFFTALNLGIGAALGAATTALLFEAFPDDGPAAQDRYEVMVTAAIGPEAVPPPGVPPQAEPALVPGTGQAAGAMSGDGMERRPEPRRGAASPASRLAPSDEDGAAPGQRLAAGQAAAMLAGGERAAAAEPPPDPKVAAAEEAELSLTQRERREVQRRLRLASHDPKLVDGIFGPATRAAIGSWQAAAGLPVTGFLDRDALALLGRQTEDEYRAWRTAEAARARKRRSETAQLHSPLPPVSPARLKCRREGTGEIAYGQNVRCDIRGLGEELRGVRHNFVELFRASERS